MKPQSSFDDRARFNWGYHDARFDLKHHLTNRKWISPGTVANDGNRPLPWHDNAYCEGYSRGMESEIGNSEHTLSSWAWLDYAARRA